MRTFSRSRTALLSDQRLASWPPEGQKKTGPELDDEEQAPATALPGHDFQGLRVFASGGGSGPPAPAKAGEEKCDKSKLGKISASSKLAGEESQAGVDVTIEVKPPDTSCKCASYRWLQVGDIDPGEWQGRADPYVDPYPNDDSEPYFWTDSEAAASPNKLTDPPRLNRSRSKDEGDKEITNKFETACMCRQAGANDRVVGVVSWGYSFTTDQTKDKKIGPTKSNSLSSFWTTAVAKDFPSYKFDP